MDSRINVSQISYISGCELNLTQHASNLPKDVGFSDSKLSRLEI